MTSLLETNETSLEFSIEEFLATEQQKDLLRFTTAGSVDDGKSTLIGRLLYDSRNVYEDHVRAVTRTNADHYAHTIDFAQLTDGLRAEREQGITIDVAYRFFSTTKRKFIIADTPGHEQYTRNMATGASTADLAIILVDARKGILTQSRRHAYIASLLGIPRVVAAINKMDLVGFSQSIFDERAQALRELAEKLRIPKLVCIPISALDGDNVVNRGESMPWYQGPSLLEHLESVPLQMADSSVSFRLPVQRVIRPHQEFRGFAGQIAAGSIRPGDPILALPSGRTSRVKTITTFDGDLDFVAAPSSVTLTLEDELDISRGDMIASLEAAPQLATAFKASLVWLHPTALDTTKSYLLKHATQTVKAKIAAIHHRVDINTLALEPASSLELNGIGEVRVETSLPLIVDRYHENRTTGSFILIDPATNATVGAGMIRDVISSQNQSKETSARVVVVGVHDALARELEEKLLNAGHAVVRTRVEDRARWRVLLEAGFSVLVEQPAQAVSIGFLTEPARQIEFQNVASSAEAVLARLADGKLLPTKSSGGGQHD
jgi:sulfate adenylyltransferase large subunit